MSGDSEQVTSLIEELLLRNRAEITNTIESTTDNDIEGRKIRRKRIRQELAQALQLHLREQS